MPANTPGHAEEEQSPLSRFACPRAKRRRMWMTEAVRQGSGVTVIREMAMACVQAALRKVLHKKKRGRSRAWNCPPRREGVGSYLISTSCVPAGLPFKVTVAVYLPAGQGVALLKVKLVVSGPLVLIDCVCSAPTLWPSW